jgi:hypothetical protein
MSNELYTGDLVTVASFPEPATANVARTALESAGIPVFVQGENANSLLPVAFMATLQVRAEDEAAAREVLAASDFDPESMEDVTAAEMNGEHEVD